MILMVLIDSSMFQLFGLSVGGQCSVDICAKQHIVCFVLVCIHTIWHCVLLHMVEAITGQ